MKKQVTKTSNEQFEVISADFSSEADSKSKAVHYVLQLQKEGKPEILLINHTEKKTVCYKKGRYDKNYRVTKVEYVSKETSVETIED